MKLLQRFTDFEFNNAAQCSCDLSTLVAEEEVDEAIDLNRP